MSKNYLIGHKSETSQPKKPTWLTFYTFMVKIQKTHESETSQPKKTHLTDFLHIYGQNSKYPSLQKIGNFFDICAISN